MEPDEDMLIERLFQMQNSPYNIYLPKKMGFCTPDNSCTLKDINKAIASFSSEYRIPFSMHVIGYKYYEIAAYMKLPMSTVMSRISFTRQKLQAILKSNM